MLRHFTAGPGDGGTPRAGLLWSDGVLYGTSEAGGSGGAGTVFKLDLSPPGSLAVQRKGSDVILSWSNPAFTLQTAPAAPAAFAEIPGATSPYTNAVSELQRFFRLVGDR
ncbi:MAG: hypothetical protein ACYC23_24145 [Limisphaerales bacterium]